MVKALLFPAFILLNFFGNSNTIETIPFELLGNLIIVSTNVDDKKGDFILDTGSPVVILNKKHFRGKHSNRLMYGVNGEGDAIKTRYSRISIGNQTWKGVYCEITNLEVLENALCRPILGLIGCQLFKKYIVEIDYTNKLLKLSLSKKDRKYGDQFKAKNSDVRTYRTKGHIPVIRTTIGSQYFNLIIDTGSAFNILRKTDLDITSLSIIDGEGQRLAGLGQAELKVEAGTILDLEVDGKVCAPMKTLFKDDLQLHLPGPIRKVNGVLGSEYLQQVILVIDFPRRLAAFLDHSGQLKNNLVNK